MEIQRDRQRLNPIYKFMLVFSLSLIAVFFVLDFIANPFLQSLIIALMISFLWIRGDS